jgi:hypothetical protein
VIKKTGFRMEIEFTAAPNAARDFTPARFSETMVKSRDSDCRHIRQKVTRSKPLKIDNARYEQAGSDRRAMREFTARTFAEQYRICDSTARRYLESLVKKGMATAIQKLFTMMSNGKEIALKRTLTTYRLK